MIEGWRLYNRAAIPTCAPHEEVNLTSVEDSSIWKAFGKEKPLLVRWTSDFDCGYETGFWYVIKDTPLDIESLKSKRRYEINKGKKFFDTKIIEPSKYINDLYEITVQAYSDWNKKYRPVVEEESFKSSILGWKDSIVIGAFSRENKSLCGYAIINDKETYAEFSVLRTIPKYEKSAINAALVNGIIDVYKNRLKDGFYICDGARAIRHETAFQDYLEKYFGFRKAYCRLHIKYSNGVNMIIKLLFPLRKIFRGKTSLGSKIKAILTMEEICRKYN